MSQDQQSDHNPDPVLQCRVIAVQEPAANTAKLLRRVLLKADDLGVSDKIVGLTFSRSWTREGVGLEQVEHARIYIVEPSSERSPLDRNLNEVEYFTQANPQGPGEASVPALLRRVADTLEGMAINKVLDLAFGSEVTAEGTSWPYMSVYFTSERPSAPPNPS